MRHIQWLLIGGPCHGETVWIKYGSRVLCQGTTYEGENYHLGGALYRIGRAPAADVFVGVIPNLIRETRLQHLAGEP